MADGAITWSEDVRIADDALDAISNHFGPSFVSVGGGRRVSFADAWKDGDATLRQRAIHAAFRLLTRKPLAAGKSPSAANDQVATITGLLRYVLMQEGGQD